jgi:hypothetical protein
MKQVMVRYKVKPERVEENEALVRAVYDELRRVEPAGLRYATYKLDDGVSFVHLAESEGERSPLQELQAFQEFLENLRSRTEEGPVVTELDPIGSFRFA